MTGYSYRFSLMRSRRSDAGGLLGIRIGGACDPHAPKRPKPEPSPIGDPAPRVPVSCRRFDRILDIQITDAQRMYGRQAVWKDVGRHLLDDCCQQRPLSHEDDGC
jgi:hypothetical protein